MNKTQANAGRESMTSNTLGGERRPDPEVTELLSMRLNADVHGFRDEAEFATRELQKRGIFVTAPRSAAPVVEAGTTPENASAPAPDRWRASTWFSEVDRGLPDRIRKRNAYAKKRGLSEPIPPTKRHGKLGYDVDRVIAEIGALAPKVSKRLADE
jgi:hypothetical protein